MSKLLTSLHAFVGNADAAIALVADALHSAVSIMAQHGTKAPVDEAVKFVSALTGRSDKEKALLAGLDEVKSAFRKIQPGKHTAEESATLAADISDRFAMACGFVLNAPKVKAVKEPAQVAAKAIKALAGLTDAQLRKALATNEGRDMLATIARVTAEAAADAAKRATDNARKAVRESVPGSRRAVTAPAQEPATV